MKILVDGLFIRSLLMAFFFKLFPEIILDGRLFIAEPPLYRINDKKNPFVINKEDYVERYVKSVVKDYKVGCQNFSGIGYTNDIEWLHPSDWKKFLSATSSYIDDIMLLSTHYEINDRLLEMIIEEFSYTTDYSIDINESIKKINIQEMIDRITIEFPEIYYDDTNGLIMGVIDGKYQLIEISPELVRKSYDLIRLNEEYGAPVGKSLVLKDVKTGTERELSLLGILKILKKYQPDILHRFKGLGENDEEDIRTTIMDPDTRTLIRVNISDIENDMNIFHVLRGNSPIDARNRKAMMKSFKIPKDAIDT